MKMEKGKNMIIFRSKEHEQFFWTHYQKCQHQDVYHAALVYCLGIDRDTRQHVNEIYDLEAGYIRPECLCDGWQTSGSQRIIRMAYNLYSNGTPGVINYENVEEQLEECRKYTVEELFCCGYAPYFWQAVKLRYPEYCGTA